MSADGAKGDVGADAATDAGAPETVVPRNTKPIPVPHLPPPVRRRRRLSAP